MKKNIYLFCILSLIISLFSSYFSIRAQEGVPEEIPESEFQEFMPFECREAGITNPEECKKLMESKFDQPPVGESEGDFPSKASSLEERQYPEEVIFPEERIPPEGYSEEHIPFTRPESFPEGIPPHPSSFGPPEGSFPSNDFPFKEKEPPSEFQGYFPPEGSPPLPPECLEAGIKIPEECRDFMKKKFKEQFQREESDWRHKEFGEEGMMFGPPGPPMGPPGSDFFGPPEEGFGPSGPPLGSPEEARSFLPPPCQQAGLSSPQECEKFMIKNFMPPLCQERGVETMKECEKILKEEFMPPECKEQGIKDEKECEEFLKQKHMPQECKEAGITTQSECEKYMFNLYAPKICRERKAIAPHECENLIFSTYGIPPECEGLTKSQCKRLIDLGKVNKEYLNKLNQELSPACQELGAKTFEECQKMVFKKNLPEECQEAGAFTPEACDKVMFEKYHRIRPEDFKKIMPEKCVELGIEDPEECRRTLQDRFFPQECVKAGIKDEKSCEEFLRKKHFPPECQEAGVSTVEECEKIMREKYLTPECKTLGLNDEKACQKYMFEKYAKEFVCEGLTESQCQLAIEKRHLGQIVRHRRETEKIKKEIKEVIGQHISLKKELSLEKSEEFLSSTPTEKSEIKESEQPVQEQPELLEVVPLEPKEEVNLLVIPAEEVAVIKEDETIINTVPAAMVLDDDKDGIPNEIEQRNNLNFAIADSDKDGENDLEEIKQKELAPPEEAIVKQVVLEQPITNGELVSDENALSIQEIETGDAVLEPVDQVFTPVEDSLEQATSSVFRIKQWILSWAQAKNYSQPIIFKGKAKPGEVIVLYIYSDLPAIFTAKANDKGEWSYALENPLREGEHQLYVATLDSFGRVIRKNGPYSLFIKKAQAVAPKEFVSGEEGTKETTKQKSKSILLIFLYSLFLIILLGVGFCLVKRILLKKKNL